MFASFGFKSLLKLIYGITKCSGLLFISIDLTSEKTFTFKTSWTYIVASFALSIVALSYDAQFDVTKMTHSELLNIGVALVVKISITSPLVFKCFYLFKGKTFLRVLSNYQGCNVEVCCVIRVRRRDSNQSFHI